MASNRIKAAGKELALPTSLALVSRVLSDAKQTDDERAGPQKNPAASFLLLFFRHLSSPRRVQTPPQSSSASNPLNAPAVFYFYFSLFFYDDDCDTRCIAGCRH